MSAAKGGTLPTGKRLVIRRGFLRPRHAFAPGEWTRLIVLPSGVLEVQCSDETKTAYSIRSWKSYDTRWAR